MPLGLIIFIAYTAPVFLFFMWFSYKLGCWARKGYYARREFSNKWAERFPFIFFWPLTLGLFILWLPFGGLHYLGEKFGCEVKI